MNPGEVVGGLAVVGLGVLIGLSFVSDNEPEVIIDNTGTFVFSDTSSTSASTAVESTTTRAPRPTPTDPPASDAPTSTAQPTTTQSPTSDPPTTTQSPTSDPPTTSDAPTTSDPPTTTDPPTTSSGPAVTLPTVLRGGIALRVVNGGAGPGAAQFITDILRYTQFSPLDPADAPSPLDDAGGIVVHGPGKEAEGRTVLEVLRYPPERLVAGTAQDRNWTTFGEDLDVLVILGPPK